MEEQVSLLDRMSRIERSSRQIIVSFNGTDSHEAWPNELTGTVEDGLTEVEAVTLIPSGRDPAELAELYVTNRFTREGPRKRYLLTNLQKELSGRYIFTAKRDFDPGLRAGPK
jgi:hypothetical protein